MPKSWPLFLSSLSSQISVRGNQCSTVSVSLWSTGFLFGGKGWHILYSYSLTFAFSTPLTWGSFLSACCFCCCSFFLRRFFCDLVILDMSISFSSVLVSNVVCALSESSSSPSSSSSSPSSSSSSESSSSLYSKKNFDSKLCCWNLYKKFFWFYVKWTVAS